MNKITFFIETYGCQMNIADSSNLKKLLFANGFIEETFFSENTNIVILNTCSVRHSAENRIYGRLGHYKKLKENNTFLLILTGCMAEKEKDSIFKSFPYVDYVIGTHHLNIIPDLIKDSKKNKVYSGFDDYKFSVSAPDSDYPFRAFVNIIHGCSNFCSYCIVPYVRGKEISRNPDEIIDDIKQLIDSNVKEIVLLGQNVNSYGKDAGFISFAELLKRIDKIDGLSRLKFITSHPRDFSYELIDVLAELEHLSHDIHLPLQSGSDKVLALMNRGYTFKEYFQKVDYLRKKLDNPRLSTDLLVGFPGEEQDDYEKILDAVNKIRFDEAYMYKYSKRKGTQAFLIKETLSAHEKQSRLSKLIETQIKITIEKLKERIGMRDTILIESKSKNSKNEFIGSSSKGYFVVFEPLKQVSIGSFINVEISGVSGHTLKGRVIE